MSKPTSGISSAVSIRVSNELLEAIKEYAIANNIINTSGRNDDRDKPNLSQAFSKLVSIALGLNTVSDSVSSPDNNDLRDTVKKLCDTVDTLSDRLASVENAIATSASEATALAKKPTESDNQESEALPIIEAINATANAPDDLQTIESLAAKFGIPFNLNVPTLKKIYIRLVPKSSDRLIDPSKASKAEFIQAFKELGYI